MWNPPLERDDVRYVLFTDHFSGPCSEVDLLCLCLRAFVSQLRLTTYTAK